jgi:hypothetical protein
MRRPDSSCSLAFDIVESRKSKLGFLFLVCSFGPLDLGPEKKMVREHYRYRIY